MNPELQPTVELSALAQAAPRYAFKATDRSGRPNSGRLECRSALADTLGFLDSPHVDPAPEIVEEVDRGDFVRRKLLIWTAPQARMPVYLLIPKGAMGSGARRTRRPGLCRTRLRRQGHRRPVGRRQRAHVEDGYHKDFGVALCRRGFLVAAPEIACFGERQTDYSHLDRLLGQDEPTTCHNAATYAFMLGKSMVGMRVRDGMRLIDYLSTLPEADTITSGSDGYLGRGHADLLPHGGRPAHPGLRDQRLLQQFPGQHPGHEPLHLQFRAGPAEHRRDDRPGRPDLAPADADRGRHARSDLPHRYCAGERRTRPARMCAILGGDPAKDVELDEFEGRHMISGRRAYDFLWERV